MRGHVHAVGDAIIGVPRERCVSHFGNNRQKSRTRHRQQAISRHSGLRTADCEPRRRQAPSPLQTKNCKLQTRFIPTKDGFLICLKIIPYSCRFTTKNIPNIYGKACRASTTRPSRRMISSLSVTAL